MQYYCPLSERKFNNSFKESIKCGMKRCLNIPTTDKFLWEKIIGALSDTMTIKQNITEKTLIGSKVNSSGYRNEVLLREERLTELNKTKENLEIGLVEIETNRILKKYPSTEVFESLKRDLTRLYKQTKSEIEDINNSLKEIGNHKRWFDWIDTFGNFIKNQRDISDNLKKRLLKAVIDFIVVDYDTIEKVHRLKVQFKIPVFQKVKEKNDKNRVFDSFKSLIKSIDQNSPVHNYSTVTDLARLRGWSTLQPLSTAMW